MTDILQSRDILIWLFGYMCGVTVMIGLYYFFKRNQFKKYKFEPPENLKDITK